jgi:hypothetical protein
MSFRQRGRVRGWLGDWRLAHKIANGDSDLVRSALARIAESKLYIARHPQSANNGSRSLHSKALGIDDISVCVI